MENDLVKEVKNKCSELGHLLYSKYDEYKDRGICDLAEVNGKDKDSVGIEYLNEIVALIEDEQKIYNNVNKRNASTKKEQLENLEKLVNNKLEEIEDFMQKKENVFEDTLVVDAEKSENTEEENAEEEEVEVVSTHKPRRWPYFVLGAATVAAVWLTTCCLKGCSKDPSRSNPTAISTEVNSTTMEPTTQTPTTVEPTTYVPTTEAVIPGSYGTFTDINDNQQIEDRAQYIIDNYYAPFMDQLSPEQQSLVTVENIINQIRVRGGRPALDNEGSLSIGPNDSEYYGQQFVELVGNFGSSPLLDGKYYNIPAYMFFVDGSKEQEFVKGYDECYDLMTYGYNLAAQERLEGKEVTGGKYVREAIAKVGEKMNNEWHLLGMHGDVNPYNFRNEDKAYLFLACMARYGQYAFEYNMNAMQPVCIEACIDYNTKEKQLVNVNDIYWGITTGEWNNIIGKSVGADNKVEPDSVAFFQDLQDALEWNYNLEKANTLNLN